MGLFTGFVGSMKNRKRRTSFAERHSLQVKCFSIKKYVKAITQLHVAKKNPKVYMYDIFVSI